MKSAGGHAQTMVDASVVIAGHPGHTLPFPGGEGTVAAAVKRDGVSCSPYEKERVETMLWVPNQRGFGVMARRRPVARSGELCLQANDLRYAGAARLHQQHGHRDGLTIALT